jgi:hypothetical protein
MQAPRPASLGRVSTELSVAPRERTDAESEDWSVFLRRGAEMGACFMRLAFRESRVSDG